MSQRVTRRAPFTEAHAQIEQGGSDKADSVPHFTRRRRQGPTLIIERLDLNRPRS